MLIKSEYIKQSLGLHLFYDRIMMEHAFFLASSLPPKNQMLMDQANMYRTQYTMLLADSVSLSNGVVSPGVLQSGEVVTPYTLNAELLTQYYTGVTFDTAITRAELQLAGGAGANENPMLMQQVEMLNMRAIQLTGPFLQFHYFILCEVLNCRLFTSNYPLLIRNIMLEGQFYMDMLKRLQERREMESGRRAMEVAAFWNELMEGHAEFLRGLFDPTEKKLIETANRFDIRFEALEADALAAVDAVEAREKVIRESTKATVELRNFKAESTKGILDCEILSILIPIAADHILREANYYLRILREYRLG